MQPYHRFPVPVFSSASVLLRRLLQKILAFVCANPVLTIAASAALFSSVLVPPDVQYLSYIDIKTLISLFCTLAVICALKNIDFFTILAHKIIAYAPNLRLAVFTLVTISFVGSMLIANDMALLTFLPLGYAILRSCNMERYMAPVFILQNIAANLGGMLTPFGNPQNLYLYSKFQIPTLEFMQIMFVPFVISISLIFICCFFFRCVPLQLCAAPHSPLSKGRTTLYLGLFGASILMIFRLIDPVWMLIITPAVLLIADRQALKQVDYGLLLTFFAFFIFAGNISRLEVVSDFFSSLLQQNTLLTSVLSCQIISNVPSAILLSPFTDQYPALLVGVNIGGTGTLIASLASLITFRTYNQHNPGRAGYYMKYFTAINAAFLIILCVACSFLV